MPRRPPTPPSPPTSDTTSNAPEEKPRRAAGSTKERGIVVRAGVYYLRYTDVDGVRRMRRSAARNLPEARRCLAEIESRVEKGKIGIPELSEEDRAAARLTVAALVERFTREYSGPKIKSPENYRRHARSILYRHALPTLGNRPAASLRSMEIEALRDALLAAPADVRLAPASVRLILAALSRCYSWAARRGIITCPNPCRGVDRPLGDSSLEYLTRDQSGALLAHVEGAPAGTYPVGLAPMVAVGLYCGLRKGELSGLRWRDVRLDGAAPLLTVARSYALAPKSGKPRHVPIHPELARILRQWRDNCPVTPEGLVFPVAADSGARWRMATGHDMHGLPEALAAIGARVEGKRWHLLRHTFASHFVMAGGNILSLQKLLGHSDLKMTMIYAHLAPDFLAAEIGRLAFPAPAPADVADLAAARAARLRSE